MAVRLIHFDTVQDHPQPRSPEDEVEVHRVDVL